LIAARGYFAETESREERDSPGRGHAVSVAFVMSSKPCFHFLRHLGSLASEAQPRFLIDRVYCPFGLLAAIVGLRSEPRNVSV
jgi:hypothetical protein